MNKTFVYQFDNNKEVIYCPVRCGFVRGVCNARTNHSLT